MPSTIWHAEQWPALLAGVGIVLVGFRPAGRRIVRLFQPYQGTAQRAATIGDAHLAVFIAGIPSAHRDRRRAQARSATIRCTTRSSQAKALTPLYGNFSLLPRCFLSGAADHKRRAGGLHSCPIKPRENRNCGSVVNEPTRAAFLNGALPKIAAIRRCGSDSIHRIA